MTETYHIYGAPRAKPDLDNSRMRIRHHQKSAYEILFSAWIYCMKQSVLDSSYREAADWFQAQLKEVK